MAVTSRAPGLIWEVTWVCPKASHQPQGRCLVPAESRQQAQAIFEHNPSFYGCPHEDPLAFASLEPVYELRGVVSADGRAA